MSDLFDNSLREVIRQSASSSPTPGGGSVSAIVACLGTAMASMVCNLTIGKKSYLDVEPQARSLLDETTGLIARLEELVDQDIAVFEHLMIAYRLPRNGDEEAAYRKAALQAALKEACDAPLQIARTCLEVLAVVEQIASIGNRMAINDAGAASILVESALQGVLLNVDINTALIEDMAYREGVLAERNDLIRAAEDLKARTMEAVRERM